MRMSSAIEVLTVFILYIFLTIYAIFLVLKKERKASLPLWILIILLFPLLGAVIYTINYFFFSKKKSVHTV